jgi:hypothetical protein
MALTATTKRKNAVSHFKRGLIHDAARRVFEFDRLQTSSRGAVLLKNAQNLSLLLLRPWRP